LLIAARLHETIEHLAFCIDGPPQIHFLATNGDKHLIQRLALVNAMLKRIDQQGDAAVESKSAPSETVVRIQRLTRLKGIGPQIATVLGTEIFYRDFANRRSLGSYLGLTPSPFKSGGLDRDLGISKAGNPRGREATSPVGSRIEPTA
jgi:transposase